jgi:hypothetical protein
LERILKKGTTFQVEKLDFNNYEIKNRIKEIQRKQLEILNREKVDMDYLKNTYITI